MDQSLPPEPANHLDIFDRSMVTRGTGTQRPQTQDRLLISQVTRTYGQDELVEVDTFTRQSVVLGEKDVLFGVEIALPMMYPGETNKLILKGAFGYGEEGKTPEVGSDAVLEIELQLHSIEGKAPSPGTHLTFEERIANGMARMDRGKFWLTNSHTEPGIYCMTRAAQYFCLSQHEVKQLIPVREPLSHPLDLERSFYDYYAPGYDSDEGARDFEKLQKRSRDSDQEDSKSSSGSNNSSKKITPKKKGKSTDKTKSRKQTPSKKSRSKNTQSNPNDNQRPGLPGGSRDHSEPSSSGRPASCFPSTSTENNILYDRDQLILVRDLRASALYEVALAQQRLGNLEEALEVIDSWLTSEMCSEVPEPTSVGIDADKLKCQLLEQLGRIEQAIAWYTLMKKRFPDQEDVIEVEQHELRERSVSRALIKD